MAKEEVVKYFIERIDTHEWWFIETDYTKPNFITTFNGSRIRTPGYQTFDGWTNDPLKAYGFDKREKAEYMIRHDVASIMPEQLMVTEHIFE